MFSLLYCEAAPLQGRGGEELPTREFHLSLDLISPAVHVVSLEYLARLHTGVGGGGGGVYKALPELRCLCPLSPAPLPSFACPYSGSAQLTSSPTQMLTFPFSALLLMFPWPLSSCRNVPLFFYSLPSFFFSLFL